MNFNTTNTFHGRRTDAALSDDLLRKAAPSIFAGDAHDSRSDRYTYIPTIDVLNGLRKEGFFPVAAQQARCRDAERKDFTKHLIRLRHESTELAINVGDSIPEIVLVNSHDGTSSYRMIAGCFRLVCANGLMVGSSIDEVRLPHKGDVAGRVIEGAYRVLETMPQMRDAISSMASTQLTQAQQVAYGRAALALRYEPNDDGAMPIEGEQLIRARRYADNGADIWSTFNRVQENMIRGGLRTRTGTTSRRMTSRAVSGIDQNVGINRGLWTLAEEMRKLVAA